MPPGAMQEAELKLAADARKFGGSLSFL